MINSFAEIHIEIFKLILLFVRAIKSRKESITRSMVAINLMTYFDEIHLVLSFRAAQQQQQQPSCWIRSSCKSSVARELENLIKSLQSGEFIALLFAVRCM